jgi:hypothetical protein
MPEIRNVYLFCGYSRISHPICEEKPLCIHC